MTSTLLEADRILRFVWADPKALARNEYEFLLAPWPPAPPQEPIDFDWYEPTAEWRRENARWVEQFGGEQFGKASAPIEGANNPGRLRRELEDAEADVREAAGRQAEAEQEAEEASHRAFLLRQKLEES